MRHGVHAWSLFAGVLVATLAIGISGAWFPAHGAEGAATACALLTPDDVSTAVGGEAMTEAPGGDATGCDFFGDQGSSVFVRIDVAPPTASPSLMEQRRTLTPEAIDAQVGGMPALVATEAERWSSVFVYPNESVQVTVGVSVFGAPDVEQKALTLAESVVARAIEAGLPVPPTTIPSTPEPSTGIGLCSILSPEEASAALGGAPITNTVSEGDACAHVGDEQYVSVYLVILRGDQAASMRDGVSMAPDQFDLAGMTAVQMDPGANAGRTASMVTFLPDESTAAYVAVSALQDVDVATTTRALAEIVAPRLRTYLGG